MLHTEPVSARGLSWKHHAAVRMDCTLVGIKWRRVTPFYGEWRPNEHVRLLSNQTRPFTLNQFVVVPFYREFKVRDNDQTILPAMLLFKVTPNAITHIHPLRPRNSCSVPRRPMEQFDIQHDCYVFTNNDTPK